MLIERLIDRGFHQRACRARDDYSSLSLVRESISCGCGATGFFFLRFISLAISIGPKIRNAIIIIRLIS